MGFHPPSNRRSLPYRDLMPRMKRGGFVLSRGKHPGKGTDKFLSLPGCLRATSEFLFPQSGQQQRMKRETAVQWQAA